MTVAVRDLLGLDQIPNHRTTATAWLVRQGVATSYQKRNGGKTEIVNIVDLPAEVRDAYFKRLADEANVEMGEYDDQAHVELLKSPEKVQDRATDNVAKLLFVTKQEHLGLTWVALEKVGKKPSRRFQRAIPLRHGSRKPQVFVRQIGRLPSRQAGREAARAIL